MIDDIDRVKERYVHGYLKLDIISALPCDVIFFFFGNTSKKTTFMAILRINKLLRLGRMPMILSDIFRVFEDMNMPLAALRLVEFLSGVILIAHWAACGFYIFAQWGENSECESLAQSNT